MTIGAPIFYPAGPLEIRDGTASRLAAVPGLKTVATQRTVPTKDDVLPAALVYHGGERTEPNGDDNVGAPSFFHELTLVVDLVAQAANDAALDTLIVGLAEATRATLLTDATWINLFEGIRRCDVRYAYAKETNAFMAQATVEFEVTFRSAWPPYAPNDFTSVAVNPNAVTQPPLGPAFSTQFDMPEPAPCPPP